MAQSATAPASETKPNAVTIADAGPCLKKISIEIPAETVDQKLRDSLDTLAVEAVLPGFRKGKAPRSLIEKRFGSGVRGETKNQLVTAAFSEAVEQHKLRVIGDPTSKDLGKLELIAGKPFAFEMEVEVAPEFSLPGLDGIDIKKPIVSISDADVDGEFEKIRINEGSLESRETAEPGDYLTGHGIMKGNDKDGKEVTFYDLKGCVVQLPAADKNGKGMILGVLVDDFSKQFGSPKAGQTATIKTRGPENHEVEGIRGTDLVITFTVDRIDRIIGASAEQIVQASGMESVEAFKGFIRSRLEQRINVQQAVVLRQQVANHLLKNTTMTLPQRLTSFQAARTLESRRMELMYRGVDPAKIEEHMAELRAASGNVAVRDLKLFFILAKASEDLNIRVDEAEINNRIAMMAFERNIRPEKLRQEIIQRNQVGAIYQQIRDHKTLDAIAAKAKVTEMSAEEFDKAMKADGANG
jgi:trigger factor